MIVMIAALVILAGCGGDSGEMPTAPDVAEATPPPQPISLGEVVWATEIDHRTQEPGDSVTSYPNNAPAIIAAVPVESVPEGAEITATWMIDGTEVPQATTSVVAQGPVDEGWVTFRFTRDTNRLFPLGVLAVTVTGPDGETTSGEVEITFP